MKAASMNEGGLSNELDRCAIKYEGGLSNELDRCAINMKAASVTNWIVV